MAEGLLSLDRVVGGFLKLARIRPLAPEPVDPDQFLRTLHGEMKTEAALAGIELVVEAGAGGRRVLADRDVLGRAVGNLVRNALQAMDEEGGTITLRSGANGGRVRIAVADDGPGMAEEVAAKAFDLHFTTRSSGSGLGLAMVRQAALRHGGEARIRSAPGEGTEVALEIPAMEGGAGSGAAIPRVGSREKNRERSAGRVER
jgi:signal transduction histidine kinase